MDGSPHREDDLARADVLRRRLYRPDATEEDRREYAALVAALEPPAMAARPVDAPEAAEVEPAPPRSRRRFVLAGIVGVAAVIGVAAAIVQQTAAPTLIFPTVPTAVATAAPAPDQPVVRLATEGATTAQEFRGRGTGTASLDAPELATPDGRLDVMITLSDSAPVQWTARRVEIRLDGDQVVRVLDEHENRQAGAIPSSYRYDGVPPTSIRVAVPPGVAWSLVVVPHR